MDNALEVPKTITDERVSVKLKMWQDLGILRPFKPTYSVTVKWYESDFDKERLEQIFSELEIEKKEHISLSQRKELQELVGKNADLFALGRHELCRTDLVKHEIHLKCNKPV